MVRLLRIFTTLLMCAPWGSVFAQADVADPDYSVDLAQVSRVDLSRQGPSREDTIRRLLKTKIEAYGPNCWNAAMMTAGLTDSVHYVSGVEFWHWMNSPFCKTVPADETLRYGDIGSIHGSNGDHFHSFMRVNDDVIFQKGSPAVEHKWEYVKTEKIVFPEYFNDVKRCKGNEGRQREAHCETSIVYHRCDPIPQDFYARNDLGGLEAELKTAEGRIAKWMQTHDESEYANYVAGMKQMGEVLKKLRAQTFTGEKEFARKALALRAAGNLVTDADTKDDHPPAVQRAQNQALRYLGVQERDNHISTVDRSVWRTFAWPRAGTPADPDQVTPLLQVKPPRLNRPVGQRVDLQKILRRAAN